MISAVEADPSIKLVFLCSPGNPTAKLIPIKDTVAIAEACGEYSKLHSHKILNKIKYQCFLWPYSHKLSRYGFSALWSIGHCTRT